MNKPSSQVLSPTQRARLEAMRWGRRPLGGAEDFAQALSHGVAGALAAWTIERSETVPRRWRDRLRQLRAGQLRQQACLDELRARLDASGALWITARGWARTVDPILPIRPMGDVDLYTTPEELPALAQGLLPRWQLKDRPDDHWGTTRLFVDRRGMAPAVDVHLDFSLFGGRCRGAMEQALARRRSVQGLWLPSAEDDWLIALIESLQGLRQRSLRRHWERQGLADRLDPSIRRTVLKRFGLRSELLYQLEARLAHRVPEQQALRWSMTSWLQAADAPLATAAWLARPAARALWSRSRTAGRRLFSSS